MQVLVDGEWQDVSAVSDCEFSAEPEAEVPEPIPTSFSMTMQLEAESSRALADLIAESERQERAARLERARRRMWLRFPYRGAVVR